MSDPRPDGAWQRGIWLLAPILAGFPVLLGVLQTAVALIQSPWPYLGWAVGISSDAGAFYLGQAPYGDPATSYTGQIYTPFFPFLISLFDRVYFWEGWTLLLVLASGAACALLIGMAALTQRRARDWTEVAAAVGVGGVAWSLVYSLHTNSLYEGRPDQVAWAFALLGLILFRRALQTGGAALLLAPLAFTLAFWTKQSAGVAVAAAFVCSVWWIGQRRVSARRAGAMAALFVAANASIAAALEITSRGWERYMHFELPQAYARPTTFVAALAEFASHAWIALTLAAAVSAITLVPGRRARARASEPSLLLLAATFTVLAVASGAWFRQLFGSEDNQFIAAVWGLGLIVADRWAHADRTAFTTAAVPVAMLVATLSVPRDFVPVAEIRTVPADVRDFASRHSVYHPQFSDLSVDSRRTVYPHVQAVQDLLWGGRQPGQLIRLLLRRRIEYVYPSYAFYESDGGRYEENFFWKLNQVVHLKYREDPATPILPGEILLQHAWRRRLGPDPAPWVNRCFGPFRLAGVRWDIRRGGGLWCRDASPNVIAMRGTPVARTELRTASDVDSATGVVRVRLPRGSGSWRLQIGAWQVGGARSGQFRVRTPPGVDGPLSIWTTKGSNARFDLTGLKLR